MRTYLIILGLLLSPATGAQEFSVDDYLVRWVVMSVGNTDFRVMKDEERSFINVYRNTGLVSVAARMSGPDAVAVGEVLTRTQEFFDAQQGASDNVAESIEAGNFTVTFRTSVFSGFTVVIQENTRNSTNAVTLSREEAIGVQPELLKSLQYIEFLNSKVQL